MSSLNPVLYGKRLFGRTLYSANPDPVTFNLNLSESVGATDALVDSVNKVILDLVTATDAALKSVSKPLADSTTITDAVTKSLQHVLADAVTPSDSAITTTGTKRLPDSLTITESFISTFVKVLADTVNLMDSDQEQVTRILTETLAVQDSVIQVTITKALADILLLQDWLSLRLQKPNLWTVNVAVAPSPSLYGRILFGRKLYSGQGGSSVTWNTQAVVRPNAGWKSFNQLEEHN